MKLLQYKTNITYRLYNTVPVRFICIYNSVYSSRACTSTTKLQDQGETEKLRSEKSGNLKIPLTNGNVMNIPLSAINISEEVNKSGIWKQVNKGNKEKKEKSPKAPGYASKKAHKIYNDAMP